MMASLDYPSLTLGMRYKHLPEDELEWISSELHRKLQKLGPAGACERRSLRVTLANVECELISREVERGRGI